jgi:hypothetical protein
MNVRAWLTIAIAALAVAAVSCGHVGRVGNVSLHVVVASDVKVELVTYQITGVGRAEIKGDIRTESPATSFERFISHVPAGKQYVVHARATSLDGVLACEGSATFDVKANATTRVNLAFGCVNVDDGMVHISIGFSCPSFTVASWTISPLSASVGSSIAVGASTSEIESDAGTSVFDWTASTGTFADRSAAKTTYLCTTPGPAILTVTATSGGCRDQQSVTVQCVAGSDAGDAL